MSLRQRVMHTLHQVSHLSGASAYQAKRQDMMRIVMFHGVGGVDYPADVFAAQLHYLQKHFSIVPLTSIVQKVARCGGGPNHEVALTFDDGLRNHYTVVYPLLQKWRIPATFFVCPGLVESGQWMWNYAARERLRSLSSAQRAALRQDVDAPDGAVETMVTWMKGLALLRRQAVEAAIRAVTPDFVPSAAQRQQYDVMTWDELRDLDPDLVTIGSHTVNHPILTTLGSEAQAYEIHESRRWLEARLQRSVDQFCYPNGTNDPAVRAWVREHYATAVTTLKGTVQPGDDVHGLRRIPTARQLASLSWRLHQPAGLQTREARLLTHPTSDSVSARKPSVER